VAALALGLVGCGDGSGTDGAGGPAAAADAKGGSTGDAVAADAESLGMLDRRVESLERREVLLEDTNAVKRLQRAYGYYIDRGHWDDAADLFAADGTIEIGLDGVYVGQDRVRQYLHAFGEHVLGGGKNGLPDGRLNEHMQLMGVVTVAPDGLTAKARWRGLVMAGQLGKSAAWGEGPYENEYVKDGGVWKIKALHWYQSMMVPYEGGWAKNKDMNGAKYVGDALPPDGPPTLAYATWPETFLPAFHFDNPVTGKPSAGARPLEQAATSPATAAPASAPALASLAERTAGLVQDVGLLEDQRQVENLQRTYGFYIEEGLWTEAASLFADDGTFEVGGRGVYVGKARVLEYLRSIDAEYPRYGRLYDEMQLQPIVHVAPDGMTAKGRWRLFAQDADYGKFGEWGIGVYENDYVKQDGVWKIAALRTFATMYSPYDEGWGKKALAAPTYSSKLEPDRAPTIEHRLYPAESLVPFHYPNPVTGGPVFDGSGTESVRRLAAEDDANPDALAETLDTLERRIGLLEDTDAVERLHAIYGYYLARNQWDDLADIFAPDGEIEIAMRGVYRGHDSVRRNLDLYGKPGVQFGLLHNHMQYQAVIHVAPDGRSAKMRSRAFSIMGNYGRAGQWMGGVYENEYVKIDGVWQIKHDQVFNTYFVPYDVGWKTVPERDPPGITPSNPPDSPPTMPFKMYPNQFVPPFHYPNPVTGNPVVTARPAE
jgi:hypothetical protein